MSRELTTTIYTYDELTTEAQNRAIEDYRRDQDFPWLSDDMSERLVEILAENKITYDYQPNLYFSLSYSQGDGAMFEGTMRFKAWTISVKPPSGIRPLAEAFGFRSFLIASFDPATGIMAEVFKASENSPIKFDSFQIQAPDAG